MKELPLTGIRVMDFGWVMAGPILGHMLADMGAEVIKIESRGRVDACRRGRPMKREDLPEGVEEFELVPLFHPLNRNKLSATINLSNPDSAWLLRELARKTDIIVENFTPGVLDKAGLSYEELKKIKPNIIVVALSAAGQYGPLRDVRTYAPSITSLAGMDSLIGYPGKGPVGTVGISYADPNASATGMVAVLAALYHRNRTGEGQYIDLPQMEAATALLGEAVLDYTMNGRVTRTMGNLHPTMAPHNNFRCQGDDKWVSIAVKTEEEWRGLVKAMGNPAWAQEERFADAFQRRRNLAELEKLIGEWTQNFTNIEVTEKLQKAGVAAAPVMDIEAELANPHMKAREVYIPMEHPYVGTEQITGFPWKLSKTPARLQRRSPLMGEHNDYVFKTLLDLSDEKIAELKAAQVIY
ncbi:MAG: CoA transferase [Chloroflexi bacterium]|nr:CoA transferase [Chloroflexota bacterium]